MAPHADINTGSLNNTETLTRSTQKPSHSDSASASASNKFATSITNGDKAQPSPPKVYDPNDTSNNDNAHPATINSSLQPESPNLEIDKPASVLCVEMARAAVEGGTANLEYTEKEEAMLLRCENLTNALTSIEQSIYKVMSPTTYIKMRLDNMLAVHDRICQRIAKQETLRPRQYTHPVRQFVVPVPDITWVSSVEDVVEMVAIMANNIDLTTASSYEAALSIDSEGPLALLQVLIVQNRQAFFIDVPKLGKAAFHTPAATSQGSVSFSTFLEASNVLKLFWDCRGDGAKLRDIGGISVDGVYDVQLMDLATLTKPRDRARIRALGQAGPQRLHNSLDDATHEDWTTHKNFGRLAFDLGNEIVEELFKKTGGDYSAALKSLADELEETGSNALFEPKLDSHGKKTGTYIMKKPEWTESIHAKRPLAPYLTRYAVNDVRFLPALYEYFTEHKFWNEAWAKLVWQESAKRLNMPEEPVGEQEKEASRLVPATEWAKIKQVDRFAPVEATKGEGCVVEGK